MSSFTTKTILSAFAGAVAVSAHGHVNTIVVDGVEYTGYDVFTAPSQNPPPTVVGWAQTATDNGFLLPEDMASPDIICHKDAENAGGHAIVAAGSSIMMQWDTWPESHHGPVVDYLANCGDSCETVDKTTLEFFKIGESGLLDGSSAPGRWASDVMIDNGNAWTINIPETLAPGNYVLRHEMIALHEGFNLNGAQLYPQCVNIQVTGSGSDAPAGVLATELYNEDDGGIFFDIYGVRDSYPIPGPALYDGADTDVVQSVMAVTSSADAVTEQSVPDGAEAAAAEAADDDTTTTGTTTTTTAEATTTSAAETTTTSAEEADETPVADEEEEEQAGTETPDCGDGSSKGSKNHKHGSRSSHGRHGHSRRSHGRRHAREISA